MVKRYNPSKRPHQPERLKRYAELAGIETARKQDKKPIDNKMDPNLLETTTLSDAAQTYIPGIKSTDLMTFTTNFTKTDFQACKADEGKNLFYSLEFSDGAKFTWQGQHTMGVPGKGVDEVIEATINIVPSTSVEFSAA